MQDGKNLSKSPRKVQAKMTQRVRKMAERNPMTNPSNNQGKMLGEQWKGQDANRLTSFATVIHPQNCSNQPKPATIDLSSKDRNGTVNLSLHMCMCICIYVCMYIYISYHHHLFVKGSLLSISPGPLAHT